MTDNFNWMNIHLFPRDRKMGINLPISWLSSLFLGVKCSRSRAIRKYCTPKGKEVTEEFSEVDVHCHYHSSHHCCNHSGCRDQALG